MFKGWTSREKTLMVLSTVLLIAVSSLLFSQWWQEREQGAPEGLTFQTHVDQVQHVHRNLKGEAVTEGDFAPSEPQQEDEPVVIDIKGAVQVPGVYTLTERQRVIDAIHEAGGLAENASTLPLNLAQPLTDGMVIYVPTKEEVDRGEGMPSFSSTGTVLDGGSSGKISINRATAEELQQLPGIGPSRAEAIVRYREENGPFTSVEDIMKVSGIGPKIFENMKDEIEL
ncbi:competence protein ComEA [Caldalkalibacillus uzonensis]|uniref:Competence protein ComEA n=1 Tax=Caldalkalibacillus uzonensis TaxID=353224 RepID=A0ABU0CU10_9BACI|nr:helix-hairpin-helix domain-containing protein [Caldalkalibacillus uzonensis]MDQ0339597.1 competence protein ComEA [Caldalkalibacillus uzonensis]